MIIAVMNRRDRRTRPLSSRYLHLLICALLVPMLSCSKKDGENSSHSSASPLPKAEAERAMQSCQAYIAQVCGCAETHSEFEERCTLAKALPQALQLNLDLSATPGLTGAEQGAVKVEARKIAAGCFQDAAKLDETICPRIAPASR